MTTSCSSLCDPARSSTGWPLSLPNNQPKFNFPERFKFPARDNPGKVHQVSRSRSCCVAQVTAYTNFELPPSESHLPVNPFNYVGVWSDTELDVSKTGEATSNVIERLMLADLDPATAKLAIGILGPFLSAFGFLFILRIVMSWYPKLPVGKFPYVIAYAPTEPLLVPTRKLIPPLGGVDVTPVVWFGLLSFLNEILVGPQGLLVLLSQQVN